MKKRDINKNIVQLKYKSTPQEYDLTQQTKLLLEGYEGDKSNLKRALLRFSNNKIMKHESCKALKNNEDILQRIIEGIIDKEKAGDTNIAMAIKKKAIDYRRIDLRKQIKYDVT